MDDALDRIQNIDPTILRYCEHDFMTLHDLLKHVAVTEQVGGY